MTKEELEKATGQELIDERNYCGVDGYYGDYLDNVNAEMLKRFNHIAELEEEKQGLKDYCDKYTKTILSLRQNVAELEAQIEKMKNCKNCANYMISGKCPSFFRTGWCKDWEMTRSKE